MDRTAFKLFEAFDAKATVTRARCNDDAAGLNALAGAQFEATGIFAALETHGFVGNCDLHAEFLSLAERASHQRHAGNAGRETQVILNSRRGPGLAAERTAVNGQHGQP